ncbi:uncharacterized protein EV154DRAFT_129444 [Mucor mucedo]|uniref:uncharacterized protein n=1 Tax=Mucor mucedo TaxID=29922 RepID=UPI00221EF61F|nr:uncharacterized protein EV154DRAFT_129444 [Mucor mucedo]KAI7869258.1 hypothetical protein EV154DRAFT_129444 [Mucor mucedo]
MANWNELPLEVLIKIFAFAVTPYWFSGKTLKEYLLISKHWSLASRSSAYANVRLKMDHIDAFLKCMLKSSNGAFVKTIYWTCIINKDTLEANLGRLLAACPNVIDLGLGWTQPNESIFSKLLLLHFTSKNGLKLRFIPIRFEETENAVRTYGYLACALKKTLEHIKVYDWPKVEGEYVINESADSLDKFKNLRIIEFHFKDHDKIFQVGSKIQNCPTIEQLRIYPNTQTFNMQARTTTMLMESFNVQPLPNIKDLCILDAKVPVDSRLLEYVMHLFPKLQRLMVAENTSSPGGEMAIPVDVMPYLQQRGQQVSVELWIKFFNYLNAMESYSVSTMFIKDYLDVFAHFPTFCECLEIIYGRDEVVPIEPYISVFNNWGDTQIIKDMHSEDIFSRRTLIYLPPYENRASVDFESIVGILESTIKALHIEMEDSFGYDLQRRILCYALEHCSVLNTLWITNGKLSDFDSSPFVVNKSLGCLRFKECMIQDEYLYELSGRLPKKIEALVFMDCTLGEEPRGSFVMIDMPYVSLGCLAWKEHGPPRREEIVFIKITKDQGISSYYKIPLSRKMTVSSSVHFNESKDNDRIFTIHIRCFDIESLLVQRMGCDFGFYLTDPIEVCGSDNIFDNHSDIFNMI